MASDSESEDKDIGAMTMPWSVAIVFCWFVLLAIGSVILPVAVLWRWSREGEETLLPYCVEGLLSLSVTACYIYAICHGPRRWITLSYPVLGVVFAVVAFFATGGLDVGLPLAFVLATVVPMWLLYRPSADRWFAYRNREPLLNIGCLSVAMLIASCVLIPSCMADLARGSVASANAMAMRGRNLFVTCAEVAATNNDYQVFAPAARTANCSNSVEYVSKFLGNPTDDASKEMLALFKNWSVIVDLPDDAPDYLPVMISANFDPSVLPREWDGVTDMDKPLPLRPVDGAQELKDADKYIVVVRRGGAAQVIKKKYLKLGVLFNRQPYKLGEKVRILTPVGEVKPQGGSVGHNGFAL